MKDNKKQRFDIIDNNINEIFKMIARVTLTLNSLSKNLNNCIEQIFSNKKEIIYLQNQIQELQKELKKEKYKNNKYKNNNKYKKKGKYNG